MKMNGYLPQSHRDTEDAQRREESWELGRSVGALCLCDSVVKERGDSQPAFAEHEKRGVQ
jgi:hypothetical protein